MASKQRVSGKKREISEILNADNFINSLNEPKRKKQKITKQTTDNNTNTNNNNNCNDRAIMPITWECKTCSLTNNISSSKCSLCERSKDYQSDDEFEDDNNDGWDDDDDDDDDIDGYDGQQYLPINNDDIEKRNCVKLSSEATLIPTPANSKTNNIIVPKQTLDGKKYQQSWLCGSCYAVNRLLDTIVLGYTCANCNSNTYTPGKTQIILTFDWDHTNYTDLVHQQRQQLNHNNNNIVPLKTYADGNYTNKINKTRIRNRYSTAGINNHEGDLLFNGLINQLHVSQLIGIPIVPPDVIRLLILFMGGFEHDAWDNYWVMVHQREHFIIDGGLVILQRTTSDKGSWRNAFGMRTIQYITDNNNNNNNNNSFGVRYEWVLQIKKIRNKDWEAECMTDIIVGVIESDGIKPSMGAGYHSYKDGYGFTGDGYKVHDGKYERYQRLSTSEFGDSSILTITVQWINYNRTCQLLFGSSNVVAYNLKPDKGYRLAAAMRTADHQLQWVSFKKYHDPIKIKPVEL